MANKSKAVEPRRGMYIAVTEGRYTIQGRHGPMANRAVCSLTEALGIAAYILKGMTVPERQNFVLIDSYNVAVIWVYNGDTDTWEGPHAQLV